MDFLDLKRNLKINNSAFIEWDIALIADSSTQLYIQAIRGYAVEFELNLRVHEYTLQDVYQPSSGLYSNIFQTIILFLSPEKLLEEFYTLSEIEREDLSVTKLNFYNEFTERFSDSSVILYNLRELNEGIWGNYANKHQASFLFQLRSINIGLMRIANEHSYCYIQDMAITQARSNVALCDPRLYTTAD
ncbi:MAG: hypothetical protein H7259_06375, partial [Cytophagales bacterium]|nr:hypothetical protein [Cytophaga sp.]